METNTDSIPSSDTTASSIIKLFFDEVNKQDVNGLLRVQDSLYVNKLFTKTKLFN
jgi:hypothetical protein